MGLEKMPLGVALHKGLELGQRFLCNDFQHNDDKLPVFVVFPAGPGKKPGPRAVGRVILGYPLFYNIFQKDAIGFSK